MNAGLNKEKEAPAHNDLLSRVVSFKKSIQNGPIKVSLYGSDKDWLTLRKIVTCVAILASGVMAGQQLNQKDHFLNRQLTPTFSIEQVCAPPSHKSQVLLERNDIRLIEVNYLGRKALAIDEASRIRLSKSAAQVHALHEAGLGWEDVYGVISAETAWIPRSGMGKNRVASHGLAQFEPATAKAIGVIDPHDHVHAVNGAAALIKEAAVWSQSKISHLRLKPSVRDAKMREGISVYYNLSSSARRQWNGSNLSELPVETQFHVANFQDGRLIARSLDRRLGALTSVTSEVQRITVEAGSESAKLNSELCEAAVSAALSMAASHVGDDVPPSSFSIKTNGQNQDYANPSVMRVAFQEAAAEQSLRTGWKGFFSSIFQQTGFKMTALKLSSMTISVDAFFRQGVTSLAQGWKAAEDWALDRGARTALEKACGITAFQMMSARECAVWKPDSALELGGGVTVLSALTTFKLIRDEASSPQTRDAINRALVSEIRFLDGGGSVEAFVEKAMALHDFVSSGQDSVDRQSILSANAQFLQALTQDGYTISDVLRLYRAAMDSRVIDLDVKTMAQMVSQVMHAPEADALNRHNSLEDGLVPVPA